MKVRFAHLADLHLGGFLDSKLRELNFMAFEKAVNIIKESNIDFVILAGDLFNTSLPGVDIIKRTTKILKELSEIMPIYYIPGSHDFSPSGKTMLSVLEEAGIIKNVAHAEQINDKIKLKYTIDEKTNTILAGIPGKKGMLDKEYYYALLKDESLKINKNLKIFVFHTSVNELLMNTKQKDNQNRSQELKSLSNNLSKLDSLSLNYFPKYFNYYAGGHIHIRKELYDEKLNAFVVYPNALFPNNFDELSKNEHGGFYIVEFDSENQKIVLDYKDIILCNIFKITIDCNDKTPEQINDEFIKKIKNNEFYNTIVLIKLFGTIKGNLSDIKLSEMKELCMKKGAISVLRSINKLESEKHKTIKIINAKNIEDEIINAKVNEIDILDRELNKMNNQEKIDLIKNLFNILGDEKQEGETNSVFEERIIENFKKIIE